MTARFGDLELDTDGFRLTRGGRDLHLARQPLDLLILLVRRRGELVTREEICTALWGSSTYEGAEHSINTTVRKIRAVLRDDPASPRYIETVVRRGYRFIAPVEVSAASGNVCLEEPAQATVAPAAAASSRFSRPLVALAGLIAAGAIAVAAVLLPTLRGHDLLEWEPLTKAVHSINRLASDGKNVYWTEFRETGCGPWHVSVNGREDATPVPVPFRNAFVADAVPGRLLLIVRDSCDTWDQKFQGSIGEFTLPSGPVRRVGSLAGEDAAYSPDGRRIAFSRFDELWVANRDASDAHRIAQAPGAVLAIHWSPDGQLLRFSVHLDNEFGYMLEEADTRTGQVRSLIPKRDDGADGLYGTWMSDGQFVFGARRGLSVNLWGIAPEKWPSSGRTVRQLTYGPLDFSRPAAIPGRNQLAVVGVQRQGELQRFDSHLQRFVPILNGISAGMADFSRDGKWAVYVTYPERELWRSRADGSDATRLTRGSLRAGLPRISPDGRQVAFTGDYSGRELRTWIVPFDGGEPRPATTPAEGTAEVAPTWSQDGARLLVRLDLAVGRNVLAIIDVASGKIERIPGSEQKFNQRWSPDGRWITATPNNMEGLDVFNVASREWRSLSKMRADYPNWSRNSESVLFCSSLDSGEEAIYRVYLASGEAERVTTLVGTPRVNDELYSRWVGLTADDSPMVLRSADLQRIYRLSFSGS